MKYRTSLKYTPIFQNAVKLNFVMVTWTPFELNYISDFCSFPSSLGLRCTLWGIEKPLVSIKISSQAIPILYALQIRKNKRFISAR